jgi:hypothetical protein
MLDIITCDRCDYTARMGHQLRSYGDRGHPESRLTIEQVPAWCTQCGTITWAERIPEVKELEEDLAWWRTAPDDTLANMASRGQSAAEYRARGVAEARRRLEWRQGRASPPRCLECGSHEIDAFPARDGDDGDDEPSGIPHPGCGGTLSITGGGFSTSRVWTFYTPEGLRLEACKATPREGLVPLE